MRRRRLFTRECIVENDVTSIRAGCAGRRFGDRLGRRAEASHGHWTGLRRA
jgi:hypothetical protein